MKVFILLMLLAIPVYGAEEVTVDGRSVLVHVPERLLGKADNPAVIALHGGASNPRAMELYSGLSRKADEAGFIAVYPEGTGRLNILTWNAGSCCGYAVTHKVDDLKFIGRVIDLLISRYRVAANRVYVTGISNGAMMAYRLAVEMSERIAAVAAVAGTLEVKARRVRVPVPVVHFHGTQDRYAPYDGGKGKRFSFNSVDATIAFWVKVNELRPEPKVEPLPDRVRDGTNVIKYSYTNKDNTEYVVLYKVIGGGHTWPGVKRAERVLGSATLDISANDLIWDFFSRHVRR